MKALKNYTKVIVMRHFYFGFLNNFTPNANFDNVVEQERNNSWKYGGRTVAKPPVQNNYDYFKLN